MMLQGITQLHPYCNADIIGLIALSNNATTTYGDTDHVTLHPLPEEVAAQRHSIPLHQWMS